MLRIQSLFLGLLYTSFQMVTPPLLISPYLMIKATSCLKTCRWENTKSMQRSSEYSKGWFGNAKLGGGATLTPDNENELFDDRKWLYNGNAMVTGYTEKDQIVLIGNAFNAIEPGAKVGYYGGTSSDFSALDGLHSA